jgi:hypothetical protein
LLGATVDVADRINTAAGRQRGGGWRKLDHDSTGYQPRGPFGKG